MMRCSSCEATHYCSKRCQKKGWIQHKKLCQGIQHLADKQLDAITKRVEVGSRTGRERRIAKLIGDRTMVSCQIEGVETEVLWDSGSQVSLINKKWLEESLQRQVEVRPVNELFADTLSLEGVGSSIPYLGYCLLNFSLGGEAAGSVLTVPFLVTNVKLKQPLIGTNVIEELVASYDQKLTACLKGHDAVTTTAVVAELLASSTPLSLVK